MARERVRAMLEPWIIDELERYRRRDRERSSVYAELPAWTGLPPEHPAYDDEDADGSSERGVIVIDIAGCDDGDESRP